MADLKSNILLSCVLVLCFVFLLKAERTITVNTLPVCSYYGDSRYASPEASLSNCSWYSQSACCKRTEVTSVFGGMYSLYGASTACQSRLNYMMCYFCSPAQGEWYDNHVRICMEFCDDTYTNCMNAKYNGHTIGEKYRNGRHFCESQQFEVVHSKQGCFDFDPGAFGSSTMSALHKVVFLISVFVSILNTV
ncbi:riboflavin-binding protein-like [Saccoglossus kowalevskii]